MQDRRYVSQKVDEWRISNYCAYVCVLALLQAMLTLPVPKFVNSYVYTRQWRSNSAITRIRIRTYSYSYLYVAGTRARCTLPPRGPYLRLGKQICIRTYAHPVPTYMITRRRT